MVGWVVEVIGGALLDGARTSLLGTPDRRALAQAVGAAADAVLADLPADAREQVAAALGERFASPPALAIDARTPVREALITGIRQQIEPLADRDLTGTGRSFLEEVGIDPARLYDDLPQAVIRAVEQTATRRPALAPLAAQLNADVVLAEIRSLRREQVTAPGPAQPGPAPSVPAGPSGPGLSGSGLPGSAVSGPVLSGVAASRPAESAVFELVDALVAVEAFADEGSRREVLRQLPAGLAGAIPHHTVPRVQALAMIRTCLGYPDGLRQLLDGIRLIEQDSQAMAALQATAARVFPEQPG
jgi:hypothetical protein